MREITFRGKRIDNGKFIEGDLINLDHHTLIATKDMWASNLLDNYSKTKTLELEVLPVIKESIGQFTGLTDKNGTKIFEGDILKSNYDNILFEIKWRNPMFILSDKNGITRGINYPLTSFEIIGNIYDNPELLK